MIVVLVKKSVRNFKHLAPLGDYECAILVRGGRLSHLRLCHIRLHNYWARLQDCLGSNLLSTHFRSNSFWLIWPAFHSAYIWTVATLLSVLLL